MYKKIDKCRVCGNINLKPILNLGNQALTGFFPRPEEKIEYTSINLVICEGDPSNYCNLVQLESTYDLSKLYSDNYGYRSGLNSSMITHLHALVDDVYKMQEEVLVPNDLVIDIASNDCTLLRRYLSKGKKLNLLGIDPTANKFKEYYPNEIKYIADFFGTPKVSKKLKGKKAMIITSASMFYDLEDPVSFCKEISKVLNPVFGVWVFEQSYMPSMVERNSFDTVVLEHLEYYGLRQVKWILEEAGLSIHKVEFNECNGGSFRVYANCALSSRFKPADIEEILQKEEKYSKADNFREFTDRIEIEKENLISFLKSAKLQGKVILGLGASTKGNSLLQYYNITTDLISHIAEVNDFKFGRVTPGTNIPIISEEEALNMNPDYFLVLPWHFKENIINKLSSYISTGGKLIFPLPNFHIVG